LYAEEVEVVVSKLVLVKEEEVDLASWFVGVKRPCGAEEAADEKVLWVVLHREANVVHVSQRITTQFQSWHGWNGCP